MMGSHPIYSHSLKWEVDADWEAFIDELTAGIQSIDFEALDSRKNM